MQVYLFKLPGDAGGLVLVQVPAGDFLAGDEKTKTPMDHAYWIGRFETTWGQYRAFERATSRAPRADAPGWGLARVSAPCRHGGRGLRCRAGSRHRRSTRRGPGGPFQPTHSMDGRRPDEGGVPVGRAA